MVVPVLPKHAEMTNSLEAARYYTGRGYRVVPFDRGKKGPTYEGWNSLRLTEEDLPRHIEPSSNIGLLTGAPSGNLADVDCDASEAVRAAGEILPRTEMIHGRAGKLNSHHWYMLPEAINSIKYEVNLGKEKTCLVELRSARIQTMVPPSIHPNGERLSWMQLGKP